MAEPRVAAGALFFDDQDNVLLVKPAYKDGWDIPGGYVEPAETPVEACQREIKEELGLEVPLRHLLVVDWAPSENEGDKVLFVFDGGMVTRQTEDQFRLPGEELVKFAFQPPEAFDNLMPARLARRLRAAISARDRGAVEYLEHGVTDWRASH
jgi:ADP-ribose pyrophosphatase YjhB (NUDIX family)